MVLFPVSQSPLMHRAHGVVEHTVGMGLTGSNSYGSQPGCL